MRIHVLGSAAGGGFPQWNCNCRNCLRARQGDPALRPRTQSSIAVSDDGDKWVLINASPDIRAQVLDFDALRANGETRGTGVGAVLLTDAQIDHVTGLLMLREGERLPVYCTEPVQQDLASGFPLLNMLQHYCGVDWHPVPIDGASFAIEAVPHLRFSAVPLDSKAPPYSPHRDDPHPGDNIGLVIRDSRTDKTLFYAPGLGEMTPEVSEWLTTADCVLVDGSFWTEDEMQRTGAGRKTARYMGHLPQSGDGGVLTWLAGARAERKILIHINNTNPILDDNAPERARLDKEGVEVAFDGMDIAL